MFNIFEDKKLNDKLNNYLAPLTRQDVPSDVYHKALSIALDHAYNVYADDVEDWSGVRGMPTYEEFINDLVKVSGEDYVRARNLVLFATLHPNKVLEAKSISEVRIDLDPTLKSFYPTPY